MYQIYAHNTVQWQYCVIETRIMKKDHREEEIQLPPTLGYVLHSKQTVHTLTPHYLDFRLFNLPPNSHPNAVHVTLPRSYAVPKTTCIMLKLKVH